MSAVINITLPFIPSNSNFTYDLPTNIHFSPVDILQALTKLKNSTSYGSNDISAILLYKYCNSLTYPIFLLFKRSIDEDIFLDAWKICCVIPVHPSNVVNYRPISIIPHLSKIFESIVYTCVKKSLNYIIIDQQHDFRPGKSTTTSSIVFISYILNSFDKKDQVDVIFTDLKKAFYTVDH